MATFDFSCEISSPKENVWIILLDEIEKPQKYNNTIKSAKILERFNNGILRTIEIPDAVIRERIEFDYEKGEIISKLIDHPEVSGIITKKISNLPSNRLNLSCQIQWHSISGKINAMITRNVEAFVSSSLLNIKEKVES